MAAALGLAAPAASASTHPNSAARLFVLSIRACTMRHYKQHVPDRPVLEAEGMRRDLVEAARGGDHEAFEVLASSAGDRLYAVARLILSAADLAEDAVQEALVRAWQQLPSLRDPDRFDAWLHRLVVNACADQGRQLRRWSTQLQPLPLNASASDDTGAVADREQLERGFSRLKPEQRAVVVLHYHSGFSAAEIALILGIPEGTARSRLHYATQAMRGALEADARQPVVAPEGLRDGHRRTL